MKTVGMEKYLWKGIQKKTIHENATRKLAVM